MAGHMKGNKKDIRSAMEQALENPRIKSQYLKEMERVFQGPKGDPGHEKDLQRLHDAYGSKRFEKQAVSYLKKYGLPDDWGALLLLLDLKNATETVLDVMEKLVELSAEKSRIEQKGLKSKLRTLAINTRDMAIADTAEALIEEIG